MPLKDKQSELAQFMGTESYYRWSPLFPRMLLSDGAKFVAENGGDGGAYWLADAIASHQPRALRDERLREMQFWKLKVTEKDGRRSAVLTCRADNDVPPAITHRIEYTDFDLPEIDLWVGPMDEKHYVLMLPSEY